VNRALSGHIDSEAVLTVADMLKSREKGGMRFELRIPSFRVNAGEFIAVVGQSGCGKSTLLDMLGLVLKPDKAREFSLVPRLKKKISVNLMRLPEPLLALLRRRDIGYVLQSGGLLPYLSVRANIMLPCRLNRYPDDLSEKRAVGLAKMLDIAEHLDKKPAFLSGGQRQRVAIARALAHSPKLVLADEPTAAVDNFTAREIRDAFRRIAAEQGVGLVMVTHDRELVRDCTDRTIGFLIEKPAPGHVISTLAETAYA
jgi:putative ABC transport system ATP-binding protein